MAPKFGTSGLRGLVTELTDAVCAGHALAFLEAAENDGTVLMLQQLGQRRTRSSLRAGAHRCATSRAGRHHEGLNLRLRMDGLGGLAREMLTGGI